MEVVLYLLIQLACLAGLYRWAEAWGRNVWVYIGLGLLSPLISAVVLLVVGRRD